MATHGSLERLSKQGRKTVYATSTGEMGRVTLVRNCGGEIAHAYVTLIDGVHTVDMDVVREYVKEQRTDAFIAKRLWMFRRDWPLLRAGMFNVPLK
jgi:hypothetical protein